MATAAQNGQKHKHVKTAQSARRVHASNLRIHAPMNAKKKMPSAAMTMPSKHATITMKTVVWNGAIQRPVKMVASVRRGNASNLRFRARMNAPKKMPNAATTMLWKHAEITTTTAVWNGAILHPVRQAKSVRKGLVLILRQPARVNAQP